MARRLNLDHITELHKLIDGYLYKLLPNNKWVKCPASVNNQGYELISVKGKSHFVHRVVWSLHTNQEVFDQIDHIDGNPSNNHVNNLREVTNRENSHNWQRHRDGHKVGASQVSADGSWQVSMMIQGRIYYIGKFDTEEQASEIYQVALKVLDQFEDIKGFRNLVRSLVSFTKGRKVGSRFYRNPPSNVGFDKSRCKWRVQIVLGGKNTMLGRFKTKEEALAVAEAANSIRDKFQNRYQFLELVNDLVKNNQVDNSTNF